MNNCGEWFRRERWVSRTMVSLILGIGLVAAGCGDPTPDDESISPSSTLGAAPSENTETPGLTVVTAAPAIEGGVGGVPAELLAEASTLPNGAWPEGYTEVDAPAESESCDGVDNMLTAHPPTALVDKVANPPAPTEHGASYSIVVYGDSAAAGAAFEYNLEVNGLCNGAWLSSDPEDDSQASIESLGDPSIAGVDRADFVVVAVTSGEATVVVDGYNGQIGDVIISAWSTDQEAARQLFETLVERVSIARAQETVPDEVDPISFVGTMQLGPGYSSRQFWAWPDEGPTVVSEAIAGSPETTAEAQAWIDGATGARIDEFASEACAIVYRYEPADGPIDDVVVDAFASDPQTMTDPTSYGQILGLSLSTYCPSMFDKFSSLAGEA